jgi:hypothetical protein
MSEGNGLKAAPLAQNDQNRLVQQTARQFVEQLTLLHGRTCMALRDAAGVSRFREELENVATTTRNLIALAHVLGAVSWQPQITFDRRELM